MQKQKLLLHYKKCIGAIRLHKVGETGKSFEISVSLIQLSSYFDLVIITVVNQSKKSNKIQSGKSYQSINNSTEPGHIPKEKSYQIKSEQAN